MPSAVLVSRRGFSTGSVSTPGGGGGIKPATSNSSLGSMGEKVAPVSGSSRSREASPCILGYDTLSMDELDITDGGDLEETALWPPIFLISPSLPLTYSPSLPFSDPSFEFSFSLIHYVSNESSMLSVCTLDMYRYKNYDLSRWCFFFFLFCIIIYSFVFPLVH